jgi:four helix bundle protein
MPMLSSDKKSVSFGFQELEVWQRAVDFANDVISVTENMNTDRKHFRLVEQLESASTSIALNIAEGKGRYSKKEFIQFLYIARGSLYETVTLLCIFEKRGWVDSITVCNLLAKAEELAKMIVGLINSIKKSL